MNNYYQPQQQQQSTSPPPLQYPIPTKPPIQLRDPQTSPSPPAQQGMMHQQHIHQQHQQHPHQQHMQQIQTEYNLWNDPTAQIGMQFGRTAMMAGSDYVGKNINRYFNYPALKHYFKVNNSYVANKIKLLLFPWRHRPWTRLVKRSEQSGQMEGYKAPRDDINAPDLYIPAMALVTYVLLTGIVAGTEHKFHPEDLGVNATAAFFLVLLEIAFIKVGCYILNVSDEARILDLFAYSGYKFIGVITTLLVGLIAPFWVVIITFIYTFIANGFFLLRSIRYIVFPDTATTNTVNTPQKQKRIYFLFIVAALQFVLMYFLIK